MNGIVGHAKNVSEIVVRMTDGSEVTIKAEGPIDCQVDVENDLDKRGDGGFYEYLGIRQTRVKMTLTGKVGSMDWTATPATPSPPAPPLLEAR